MDWIDDLIGWILAQGTSSDDPRAFVEGLAARMAAADVPVQRLEVSMPSLHPLHQVASVTWHADDRLLVETIDHGALQDLELERSPVHHLLSQGRDAGRWNLRTGEDLEPFPLLRMLSQEGWTDYVLRIASFPCEAVLVGMAASIATTAATGFTEDHVAGFERILPALSLAIHRMAVSRMASDLLRFYVGPRTSTRILGGEIQRGKGQAIYAAILLADLKDFTGLNERFHPGDIVRWLNEHFEAIGAAVEREGGEILKLMGDSLLAIFPVGSEIDAVSAACRDALTAAQNAMAATDALNRTRVGSQAPAIGVDIVLHLGEVFYGNIGAAQRLDFTVIGPVVNEAARLEALCDRLRRRLLLSSSFAEHCAAQTVPLGSFQLKGVATPQMVFGIAGLGPDASAS